MEKKVRPPPQNNNFEFSQYKLIFFNVCCVHILPHMSSTSPSANFPLQVVAIEHSMKELAIQQPPNSSMFALGPKQLKKAPSPSATLLLAPLGPSAYLSCNTNVLATQEVVKQIPAPLFPPDDTSSDETNNDLIVRRKLTFF